MQYIALGATSILPGEDGHRLEAHAGLLDGLEETPPECILHARYDNRAANVHDEGLWHFEGFGDAADDDYPVGLTGWKRLTAWTGAAVISWGIVIGVLAVARALLS